MIKWEYYDIFVGSAVPQQSVYAVLDGAGEEGWEFTGYVEEVPAGRRFWMKRLKPQPQGGYER